MGPEFGMEGKEAVNQMSLLLLFLFFFYRSSSSVFLSLF